MCGIHLRLDAIGANEETNGQSYADPLRWQAYASGKLAVDAGQEETESDGPPAQVHPTRTQRYPERVHTFNAKGPERTHALSGGPCREDTLVLTHSACDGVSRDTPDASAADNSGTSAESSLESAAGKRD